MDSFFSFVHGFITDYRWILAVLLLSGVLLVLYVTPGISLRGLRDSVISSYNHHRKIGKKRLIEYRQQRNREAFARRKAQPLVFPKELSEVCFEELAQQAVKAYPKRALQASVVKSTVTVTVPSKSGASSWIFEIDFNDGGTVTGCYEIQSERMESAIPTLIGDRITDLIRMRLTGTCDTNQ